MTQLIFLILSLNMTDLCLVILIEIEASNSGNTEMSIIRNRDERCSILCPLSSHKVMPVLGYNHQAINCYTEHVSSETTSVKPPRDVPLLALQHPYVSTFGFCYEI